MFRFLNFLTRACAEVTELFKIVTVMFTTAYGAIVVLMKIRVALQEA